MRPLWSNDSQKRGGHEDGLYRDLSVKIRIKFEGVNFACLKPSPINLEECPSRGGPDTLAEVNDALDE